MTGLWQFLTSATAPWWTGLLGVVVGAVFGLLGARAADKRRMNYEDQRRWSAEVRTLYVQAAAACHIFRVQHQDPGEAWEGMYESTQELRRIAAEIEIITPVQVGRAMNALVEAAEEMLRAIRLQSYDKTKQPADFSLLEFRMKQAVRESLGTSEN